MKIRMRVSVSGTRGDGTEWPPAGEVAEVGDDEGAQLCAGGLAEPVAEKASDKAETRPSKASTETRKK
jgi:hypothetical protein